MRRVVQYSQIDSIGVSGEKKGLHWYQWYNLLVPIENDVIPVVLLVNMHLIKGTWIIFSCGLAGYSAIPMVQRYDWYQ